MKDSDKTIPQLLDDLDNLSQQGSSTNPTANVVAIITALGKVAGIQRILSEGAEKSSKRIEHLTWAMLLLTIVLIVLTIVMLCKM